MNEISSFSALMNLSRTSTINLTYNPWPDKDFNKNWYDFINYLNSFSDEEKTLSDITDKKLELLQKLINLFFQSEKNDISIITRSNKKNIPQILHSVSRLFVNGNPLSDKENLNNLISFLTKIPTSDYPRIAIPLMKFYLRSKNPEEELRPIVVAVFSTLTPSLSAYEKDLNLYINTSYLFNKLKLIRQRKTFEDVLKEIGISQRYINTPYMKSLFFSWFFNLNFYDYELLHNNQLGINECTSDEKKLVFAKIITSTFSNNLITDKDTFIRQIDEEYFPTPQIDKTEPQYWTLVNSDLEDEKNIELLKDAHKYYNNIFTRFIITRFFDSLSDIASDSNGIARANYWRKYGTSDSFVDIKLVVNKRQRRHILAGLVQKEINIISKHIIFNYTDSDAESPLFIIIFTTKTIVVFLQINNAAQVFDSDNPLIKRLLNSHGVSSYVDFKLFKRKDGILDLQYGEQGRVVQHRDWQYKFTRFLARHGINQGNE